MTNLLLAHVNTRSLLKNFITFKDYFTNFQNKIHVIAVTETWLHTLVSNQQIHLPGYIILRNDRDGRGGGVALYLDIKLNITQLNITISITSFEYKAIKCTINKHFFIVVVIYRSPSLCDFNTFLLELEMFFLFFFLYLNFCVA